MRPERVRLPLINPIRYTAEVMYIAEIITKEQLDEVEAVIDREIELELTEAPEPRPSFFLRLFG